MSSMLVGSDLLPSFGFVNKTPSTTTENRLVEKMGTQNLHKVFVYGTLKKGEPNHQWFSKDQTGYHKYLYNAKTTEKYPLIIGTKYNIPFLLNSPGNGTHVEGEVYEVDDKVLANLDVLEDHPNYYVRQLRDVRPLVDGDTEPSECGSISSWILEKNY
ncbi:hypothetical protein NQ318_002946 [Aromia moschata]|uniref:Gamma-glutamylcyclotransferase family protein n=1 Tax=Aromia moschata TaxID=1265417 RepID=A0AAV8X6L8_9CUCU|nr:hypothetical protein NQ318_002946 [Aromia moschata]